MRKFIALTQIMALVTISLLPALAQPTQGRKIGNITGLITAKKQKDENKQETGDTSLQTTITSDVPIDQIKVEIPAYNPALKEQVKTPILPLNWTAIKDEAGFFLNGPARFDFKLQLVIPSESDKLLEQFLKNGANFSFSFGEYDYGERNFVVEPGEPITPVTPGQAANIPQFIRAGQPFSITPYEGYTDGVWKFIIGGQEVKEIGPNLPEKTDLPKIEGLTEKQKKTIESTLKFLATLGTGGNPTKTSSDPPDDPPDLFGFSPEQKKALVKHWENLKELLKYSRELIVHSKTYRVPSNTPPGAKVEANYKNAFGETTAKGAVPTTVLPGNSRETAGLPPRLISCTPKLFPGDTICVCGLFPSSFFQNALVFDGKYRAVPLSSSTDMVTYSLEGFIPGRHMITWDMKTMDRLISNPFINTENRPPPSAQEKVEFVILDVKPSMVRRVLEVGDEAQMQLIIIGTDEKLPIRLTNKTPGIIQLEGGDLQTAMTSGRSPNILTRIVTGNLEGEFDIEYVLDLPPCPCNPVKDVQPAKTETTTKPTETTTQLPENPPDTKPTKTATDDNSDEESDCYKYLVMLKVHSELLEKFKKEYIQTLEKCNKDLSFLPASINRHKFREECREAVDNYYIKQIDYYERIVTFAYLDYLVCNEKPKKNPR